jgi:hypothetical protein
MLSISRILALWHYYHAPLSLAHTFETYELPRLLNETGRLPLSNTYQPDIRVNLSAIRQLDLRLCASKEWHRFPGHYLVPEGVRMDFVKSEFTGLLPGHFSERAAKASELVWWPRAGTRDIPEGLNDRNQENPRQYVRYALLSCPISTLLTYEARSPFTLVTISLTSISRFTQYQQLWNHGMLSMTQRGNAYPAYLSSTRDTRRC